MWEIAGFSWSNIEIEIWCTYALDVEFSMISLSDAPSGVGSLRPEHFQFNSNSSPASNLWYILSNSSADGSSSSFGPKHGMLQSSALCCIESILRPTNLFIYLFTKYFQYLIYEFVVYFVCSCYGDDEVSKQTVLGVWLRTPSIVRRSNSIYSVPLLSTAIFSS